MPCKHTYSYATQARSLLRNLWLWNNVAVAKICRNFSTFVMLSCHCGFSSMILIATWIFMGKLTCCKCVYTCLCYYQFLISTDWRLHRFWCFHLDEMIKASGFFLPLSLFFCKGLKLERWNSTFFYDYDSSSVEKTVFEQNGETTMLCKHSVGALHSHPVGAKEINCFCTYYYRFLLSCWHIFFFFAQGIVKMTGQMHHSLTHHPAWLF